MTSTARIAAALAWAGALAIGGCKPVQAGVECKSDGQQVCTSASSGLVCDHGKWFAMPCRGAGGCSDKGGVVVCANDTFEPGEWCDFSTEEYACSVDKRSALRCMTGHWKIVDRCLGPKGCASAAGKVSCDDGVSNDGAPCEPEGDHACSSDGRSLLVCAHGSMIVEEHCRGAAGCRRVDGKLSCDDGRAEPGDACSVEADPACSMDGKSLLTCKGGARAVSRACPHGCVASGDVIACN